MHGEGREVDVRGQVAIAWISKNVLDRLVLLVAHQRARGKAASLGDFLGCIAVVDREHVARFERRRDSFELVEGGEVRFGSLTFG